jgi:hypothetical protein
MWAVRLIGMAQEHPRVPAPGRGERRTSAGFGRVFFPFWPVNLRGQDRAEAVEELAGAATEACSDRKDAGDREKNAEGGKDADRRQQRN